MKKILLSILFLAQIKTATSQDMCSDLISHYSFDNTLSNYFGANPFSGTGTYAGHQTGQCVLTASNATRTVSIPGLPLGNSARTIAMWFHPNGNASGTPTIFSYGSSAFGQMFGSYYSVATKTLTFQGFGAGNDFDIPNTTVNQGTWMHLALTYDATSGVNVYVNGQFKTQMTPGLVNTGSAIPFTLGGNGTIYHDDLRIYDRVLSATDITELYNNIDSICNTSGDICTNLISAYSFDRTNSNNQNAEAFSGAVTYTTGIAGECATATTLQTNITGLPVGNSNRTISFWLKRPASSGSTTVFTYGASATDQRFGAYVNTGTGELWFQSFGSPDVSIATISSASLQHIAFTYNGTKVSAYVNGILVKQFTRNLATAAVTMFQLNAGVVSQTFDDLKIFSRALNQDDIYKLYQAPQYLCGINSGNDLCDGLRTSYSFNNTTANQSNVENFSETFELPATYTTGVVNDAMVCQAGSSYTAAISGLPLGNSARTVSLWFKNTGSANNVNIFNYGSNAGGAKFGAYFNASSGALTFQGYGTGNDQLINNTSITANNWIHIAAVYTGTFVQVYINGVCKETFQRTLNTGANNMEFQLGQFGGLSDDLRIYNRALSEEDINDLYNNPEYACSIVTGITNINQNETDINVYPNPANDLITISFENNNTNASVNIVNTVGAVVLSKKLASNTETFDISNLSNGIYFVQLKNNNKVINTKKLVVSK